MKEPLISILIPCYNNQVFIYELLRSIFEQTYHNIEILIRDDASASFSVEKLIEWIRYNKPEGFCRVVISQNEENLGTVANLERLQQDSKGEYLFHIAADDVLYDSTVMQRFVEELKRLRELGQEPEAIIAQVEMWDHDIKEKQSDFIPEEIIHLIKEKDYVRIFGRCASTPLLPAQYLYQRNVKEKIGKLSDQYRLIEDWPSILRMTRMGVRLSYMDGLPSVKHRHGGISHGNTLQSKQTFIRFYKELIEIYYNEVEPYEEILSEEDRKTARKYAIDRTNALIWYHIPAMRKQEKESLELVNQAENTIETENKKLIEKGLLKVNFGWRCIIAFLALAILLLISAEIILTGDPRMHELLYWGMKLLADLLLGLALAGVAVKGWIVAKRRRNQ